MNANNGDDASLEENIEVEGEWEDREDDNDSTDDSEEDDSDKGTVDKLDLFIQNCLRLARNDKNLFKCKCGGDYGCNWRDSDMMLLGGALVGNTFLRSIGIHHASNSYVSTDGANALRRGISESKLQSLELRSSAYRDVVDFAVLQGVAASHTLQRLSLIRSSLSRFPTLVNGWVVPETGSANWNGFFHLTDLSLKNCGVKDRILSALLFCLSHTNCLVSLALENNGITDEGIDCFCQYWRDDSPLQVLNFKKNNLGSYGAKTLLLHATLHVAMRTIILSENKGIGYNGLESIGELLPQISLQHLELDTCMDRRIEDVASRREAAVVALASGLQRNASLLSLSIANNSLGCGAGAKLLMQAIVSHPTMNKLVLSGNKLIGYDGLLAVGELLPQVRLQHLQLDKCVNRTQRTLPFRPNRDAAVVALTAGLQRNTSLVTLSIRSNGLGPIGAKLLMQAIAVHPTLESLSLKGDLSIGLSGLRSIGTLLPQVRLKEIKLGEVCSCWPVGSCMLSKLAVKAGQALLEGVKNNYYLTKLTIDNVVGVWNVPIQFHVNLNRICRPLLWSQVATAPVWAYILARFNRDNKMSYLYFCLREQPWLINVKFIERDRRSIVPSPDPKAEPTPESPWQDEQGWVTVTKKKKKRKTKRTIAFHKK